MRFSYFSAVVLIIPLSVSGCAEAQNEMSKEAFCQLAEGGKTEAEINLKSFPPHVRQFMEAEDPANSGLWKGQELSRDIAQRVVDFCEFEGFERLKPEYRPKDWRKK